MTNYVPIQGTNSWTDIPLKRLTRAERLWWQSGSAFTNYLLESDLKILHPEMPFIWDTDISGVFWTRGNRDWQAAGAALRSYFELAQTPMEDRNIVAHSHGLQVVLYACGQGLQIRNLISVGGPVRVDMEEVAKVARLRIGYWLAISDPDDQIQREGEWFDGAFGYVSKNKYADVNDQIKGIAHSNVLYDPSFFHYWRDNNWPDFLKMDRKP